MNKKIMHVLTDYISAYEKYKDYLENKVLINRLTKVYNELLSVAEKHAHSYNDFEKECTEKKIFEKFDKAIKQCRKEFDKLL
ncbi:MAG: hypothetical protein V1874_16755 [Spirochaetota bacterium]